MVVTQKAVKHAMEDVDSWNLFLSRETSKGDLSFPQHRNLHRYPIDSKQLEREKELQFQLSSQAKEASDAELRAEELRIHQETLKKLWQNPGIEMGTVHGMMIDAGSTGSRLHVFEWAPRVLRNTQDIEEAVSGEKLSFPTTNARWTDRLRPGLATFAAITDDKELRDAVAEYLSPLLEFARTVLHEKQTDFFKYPIFLRATAGMRTLNPTDRARLMNVVRDLFRNKTYCPFQFTNEQARVLSGEEESIYDWAGVNFLMGDLLEQSEGAGTVINPKRTHGALDMGGASTQIGFYVPGEDIMSNLFKLQIGQAKHWNVYAHSFLFYGMNEAMDRFHARLAAGKSSDERLVDGIHNPCLPGGAQKEIRSNIHMDEGIETWNYTGLYPSGDGYYQALLKNDNRTGDFDTCMDFTKNLLHLDRNDWCEFQFGQDCSVAGIYQPSLPSAETFGEFVAFSNYNHVWKFLGLPKRASIAELLDATRDVCSMSMDELVEYSNKTHKKVAPEDLDSYCFRSVYVFQLLYSGYGFRMEDTIYATKLINGQKVGWALGAMLYEINSMPWKYVQAEHLASHSRGFGGDVKFLSLVAIGVFVALIVVLFSLNSRRYKKAGYEPLKQVFVAYH